MLSQILRFGPKVRHAMVMIDPRFQPGPGGAEPTAMVSLRLENGAEGNQEMANSVGDLVSGVCARLSRGRIHVQINDHSYALSDVNDQSPAASGQEWLARVRDAEKHYTDQLRRHLQLIDGVFVMVTCEMNNERSEKSVLTLDSKNAVTKVVSENTSTEE